MDNFIDILIYVLIIATFLSSLFRKKKVPPKDITEDSQVQHDPINRPVTRTQVTPQKQPEEVEFDLFKEFENFFNTNIEKPKQQETKSFTPVRETQRNREDYIPVPEKSFHEKTASEHSNVNKWERKRTEIEKKKKAIDTRIEKEASQFEKFLHKEVTPAINVMGSLNQKLKSPSTLREYIVISEILGKPRVHRKWNPRSIS